MQCLVEDSGDPASLGPHPSLVLQLGTVQTSSGEQMVKVKVGAFWNIRAGKSSVLSLVKYTGRQPDLDLPSGPSL